MNRLSIRWKLTLWYGGVLAVVLTVFSIVVFVVLRHQLLGRIDQGLGEELADVLSEIHRHDDSATLLEWFQRRFAYHEGFDFEITTADGERFFVNPRLMERSLSFAEASPPESTPQYETLEVSSVGHWRLISTQATGPDGTLDIRVGRSLHSFESEMNALLLTFLLTGPLTLLAAIGGGYVLACRALQPVQTITQTARRISADQLNERIRVDNRDDELGTLAATLNDMIERLERSFAEMKRFTADAAHELRTPLAVIRNEAEVALRSARAPEEYCRVLENLLEETNRLATMADQLLFLSRQEAGLQPGSEEPVEMSDLLAEVVTNMQLLAEEKGIVLTLNENPPCSLTGDSRQFRRVFYNLLDNAIKYTGAGGKVTVTSRSGNGERRILISDTGVGIPPEHIDRICDRFYRVDPARSGEANGAGLGLSICRSIVRGTGGEISVESRLGSGTTVTVHFPEPPVSKNAPAQPQGHI